MKNDYSKEAFLLKIFKEELNHSQNIIKYSKKPNGKNLRIEEALRRYLAIQERLNEVALSSDNKMKYLKMLYHEKYCAKKENIHSFITTQKDETKLLNLIKSINNYSFNVLELKSVIEEIK